MDTWTTDMKLSLEKEITDLDAKIKLRKAEAKIIAKLAWKDVVQRAIKELEKHRRSEKRMKLYKAQDEVDIKKDALLTDVEKMLAQKVTQTELFTIK